MGGRIIALCRSQARRHLPASSQWSWAAAGAAGTGRRLPPGRACCPLSGKQPAEDPSLHHPWGPPTPLRCNPLLPPPTAHCRYKFCPAEELISLPGDIARTEFRLVVTLEVGGWAG